MRRFTSHRPIPVILTAICCLPLGLASAQAKAAGSEDQTMTVTSLEYRERNAEKPYLVEGKTSGPPPLIYKLVCKRGAAALKAGRQYKVSEEVNEDGVKVLFIWLTAKEGPAPPAGAPPGTTIVGIECEIESAKINKK
jgi:hypothetical protein